MGEAFSIRLISNAQTFNESARTYKRWRRSSIIVISSIFWADTCSVHYACARTNEIFGQNMSVDRLLTVALSRDLWRISS